MPDKATLARARADLARGDSPSTAAGEFVRQEIDNIRAGKHGARSTKQAIAIGLAEARRAGIPLAPRKGGTAAARKADARDLAAGAHPHAPDKKRSAAATAALAREPQAAASHRALSTHARKAATKRTASERSAAARKGARTRARAAKRA